MHSSSTNRGSSAETELLCGLTLLDAFEGVKNFVLCTFDTDHYENEAYSHEDQRPWIHVVASFVVYVMQEQESAEEERERPEQR